jgi:two-component system LytT family sensor kinase
MIDLTLHQPKERKLLLTSMSFILIGCIIGFEILYEFILGESVTLIGVGIYLLQIAVYFVCQFWVVPKAFEKKMRWVFFFRFSILISISVIIRGLIVANKKDLIAFFNWLLSAEQLIYASYYLVIVLILSFFMGIYRRNEQLWNEYINAVRLMIELESAKLRIENIVTQMRLSPHLLFNTLSFIKTKAETLLPEIAKAVDLLSGILRHAMIDVLEVEKVSLKNEIEKVKDLIDLQYQLAQGMVFVNFEDDYDNAEEDVLIPPYTLLTLAENVFRYGVVNDADYPASIKIKREGKHFMFSTSNYKKLDPHPGTGMGIKSVGSTLGYYYTGRHNLEIKDSEENFLLTLNIEL